MRRMTPHWRNNHWWQPWKPPPVLIGGFLFGLLALLILLVAIAIRIVAG